jgi:SagB-type dehydrogenase family enzyme
MKKIYILIILTAFIGTGLGWFIFIQPKKNEREHNVATSKKIKLPEPKLNSNTSVEQALLKRRSIREFKEGSLTLDEVSQILWAAQGITNARDLKTTPSAGALYPLEVYAVIGNVRGVETGVYKYKPHQHELIKIRDGDVRDYLSNAALGQTYVRTSAVVIVFSAVYERTTHKYGDRGIRYTHMEVGHASQNVYLQAVSLNLGTVVIGAFHDNEVRKILNMPDNEHPLYIMPVGKIKK